MEVKELKYKGVETSRVGEVTGEDKMGSRGDKVGNLMGREVNKGQENAKRN